MDTSDRKKAINTLIKSINKTLGESATISSIAEVRTPYLKKRPTGIMGLDMILRGGFPAASLIQIHGPDGVGKDALTNLMIAQNQRIYGEDSCVFWMSFGYSPDLGFMRLCDCEVEYAEDELRQAGYDPAQDVIPDEARGHTVGDFFHVELGKDDTAPSEALFEAVLQLVDSGLFQLGIINELGSGETKDGRKKELMDNPRMAEWASLVTRFCQRWYSSIRRPLPSGEPNETTVVVLNPVRANTDTMSAKFRKHNMTSGHALKHAKVVDLHLRPGKSIKRGGKKVGKEIVATIAKGKHGLSEGASCRYTWLFDEGVDLIEDLANVAKAVGTVHYRGRNWYVLGDEDNPISGGFPAVAEALREDPKLVDKLRAATLEAAEDAEYDDDNDDGDEE